MSYILDALKKSDQQRQRNAAPTLLTVQTQSSEQKRPAHLFYGLLAGILVSAGVAIGWLRPWQTEPPAPASLPVSAPVSLSAPTVASSPPARQAVPGPLPVQPMATAPEPAIQEKVAMPEKQAAAPQAPLTENVAKQPAPASNTEKPRVEAIAAVATPRPAPGKPVIITADEPVQEQKVMSMAELPPHIRQEIPKISVALHAYAKQPKERLVSINDMLLREGDHLTSDLKLEQITPKGMIFDYKGYRFQTR